MKNLLSLVLLVAISVTTVQAQLTLPPNGNNQRSITTQYIGSIANVTIEYYSPDVTSPQGVSRKGQIWGQLVPYGLNNLQFGLSTDDNPSPWRAGANENTVITFSHDVEVQGKPLAAGSYGFHIIPKETGDWTLIFSNNSTAWGSYFYETKDDALQVQATPEDSEYQEWLTYEFDDRQADRTTVLLKWENKSIPFEISIPDVTGLYVEQMRKDMQGPLGFNWNNLNSAAAFCLQNNTNLDEALIWAESSVNNPFAGNKNITTLSTLAMVQAALGKKEAAASTIDEAANHPTAGVFQLHNLGRQLLNTDMKDKALSVFEKNSERNGNVWPVNVGLTRAYSAVGKFDLALKHVKLAIENAPNAPNKNALEAMIEKLENKEDIN